MLTLTRFTFALCLCCCFAAHAQQAAPSPEELAQIQSKAEARAAMGVGSVAVNPSLGAMLRGNADALKQKAKECDTHGDCCKGHEKEGNSCNDKACCKGHAMDGGFDEPSDGQTTSMQGHCKHRG